MSEPLTAREADSLAKCEYAGCGCTCHRDAAREGQGLDVAVVPHTDHPPVGLTPEMRCPRCFGGYFRCDDPWHAQQRKGAGE